MCFQMLKRNFDSVAFSPKFKKPTKTIPVYKVLTVTDSQAGCVGVSPYKPFGWHKGLNKSSRSSTRITPVEKKWGSINEGFHFYLKRSHAVEHAKGLSGARFRFEVVTCYVRPRNVVARNATELVATKATISSFYMAKSLNTSEVKE